MSFFERFKWSSTRTASFMIGTIGLSGATLTLICVRCFGGGMIKSWKMKKSAAYAEHLYQLELPKTEKEDATLEN